MRPFLGSEALAAGTLTRGQLRWRYTALFPDVYVPRAVPVTDYETAEAAWLWTGRSGIITGRTAARLLGAYRIPTGPPVEVITSRRRPPSGLTVRAERIAA